MKDTVEVHFIDGPLAGTRKIEPRDLINRNRSYRYLAPTNFKPEQIIPNDTANVWVDVRCVEYIYLPFKLPGSYGTERYAMCLERGLS